jgi:hypothetical protein
MNTNTATEYRNLPLAVLTESSTNPRRIFEDSALKGTGRFCGIGRQEAHGSWRSTFRREHNG